MGKILVEWLTIFVDWLRDNLVAVSVLCGPALWLLAFISAGAAWQDGIDGVTMLKLLGISFVCACWAVWGIVSGPLRLRYWWFGMSSLLNLVFGGWVVTADEPYHGFLAFPFLAYSLWQAHVFERLRSSRNS